VIAAISVEFDETGQATRWSADAENARLHGNMQEASDLHTKAGELLEGEAAKTRNAANQATIRFLAATQLYLGGHYARAAKALRKIQSRELPDNIRPIYAKFEGDVRERASPDYKQLIRDRLFQHWQRGEYRLILELLQEHYYAVEEWRLAFFRAQCCEKLGNYKAAAIFAADAIRHSADPNLVLTIAVWPLRLCSENKMGDAWEFAQLLLMHARHPLMTVSASLVQDARASVAGMQQDRERIRREQLRLAQQAEAEFSMLPAQAQSDRNHREFVVLAIAASATAHRELGNQGLEEAALDRAIEFDPTVPFSRIVRGYLNSPAPDALEDFRKAIELGEQDHVPFASLAEDTTRRLVNC
jgi:tetratricopeptide (TPR) repeat protein